MEQSSLKEDQLVLQSTYHIVSDAILFNGKIPIDTATYVGSFAGVHEFMVRGVHGTAESLSLVYESRADALRAVLIELRTILEAIENEITKRDAAEFGMPLSKEE